MDAIVAALNITEETRASVETVQALPAEDRLKILEALMLGELSVTKEGLGFPVSRATGPRGPGEKVLARQAIVREVATAFMNAGETFCITDMKDKAEKRYQDHDIQPVLDQMVAEDLLVVLTKGRKQFFQRTPASLIARS